jgi:hypothetical protein
MKIDLIDLNLRFTRYMSALRRHFIDDFKVTTNDLEELFIKELEPMRKFQDWAPGLKAKLDAFEAIPSVTPFGKKDEEARVRFARALQDATNADGASRDKHLNRLCAMFTIFRGEWFVSLFTDSLPAVRETSAYGGRFDLAPTMAVA